MASMEQIYLGPIPCFLCKQDDPSAFVMPVQGGFVYDDTSPEHRAWVEPSIWMHEICYKVFQYSILDFNIPLSYNDILRFAKASKLLYPNPHELEGRRTSLSNLEGLAKRISTKISSLYQEPFRHDLFARFPAEIKLMIVDLIGPCWYLTIVGETRRLFELWLKIRHQKQCAQLKVPGYIWVYTIIYRGVRYVARLSEKKLDLPSNLEESRMELPNKLKQIVLSMDCVGIREIQPVSQYSKPVSDGSPWYKILDVPGPKFYIRVDCEGLFVRDIYLVSHRPKNPRFNIWSSPVPPKQAIPRGSYRRPKDQYRIHYEKLDSNTKGIVACCANDTTIGIHAFSELSRPYYDFVDLMHRRVAARRPVPDPIYWIYFPLNSNEHVDYVSIRELDQIQGEPLDPVLIMNTSLGRDITCGPQIPASFQRCFSYLILAGDKEVKTGIFHDTLDPDSSHMTAFGVTGEQRREVLLEPPPRYEPPYFDFEYTSMPSWYLTRAPLNGLVKAQLCRDPKPSHRPCIGMLLFYNDQHIEAKGEIRWELDMSQEVMAPRYLELADIENDQYIKDVLSSTAQNPEHDDKGSHMVELPESGTINLWFDQTYGTGYTVHIES